MLTPSNLRFNFILQTISDRLGESKFGAFGTRTVDLPLTVVIDQAQFAARPPPIIDFARYGKPDSFFLTLLAQEAQEIPIDILRPLFR